MRGLVRLSAAGWSGRGTRRRAGPARPPSRRRRSRCARISSPTSWTTSAPGSRDHEQAGDAVDRTDDLDRGAPARRPASSASQLGLQVGVHGEPHRVVVARAALQLVRPRVGDHPAAGDDHGAGADRVDLFQDVRGDDDRLVARPSRRSAARTPCFWLGSRPSVGSSSTSTGGSCMMAWARPTRRLKPLDRVSIGRCATSSSSVRAIAASIRRVRSSPSQPAHRGDEAQEAEAVMSP